VGWSGVGAGIMLGLYNALGRTAYAGVYPAVRAGLVGADWRWQERTGHYPPLQKAEGKRVWIHAASVGESKAAAVLVEGLLERHPGLRLVVSTITPAGWETARQSMPDAEAVVQAPVDLRGPVRRALSWFDPSLFVVVETEIWPNMALECHRRGTKLVMASAKLSGKSYGRYRYIRPLMKYVLSSIVCVGAQTEVDRERLCGLGLDESRARVTGDIKLDSRAADVPPDPPGWLSLVAGDGDLLFTAGSTRPGEEEIVGKALLEIGGGLEKRLVTVVAPRHIDRCSEVTGNLRKMGLNVARRSSLERDGWSGGPGPRVLVLDTIGELVGVYTKSDFVFVGGTLAPFGGHNLVEPAMAGVPVLFGSSLESVRTVADALIAHGGGAGVAGAGALTSELTNLSLDRDEKIRRGQAASAAIKTLRGAVGRTLDFFEEAGVLPPSK
jgi:3-deoxy-D-manno-octulosonic-acid transferase